MFRFANQITLTSSIGPASEVKFRWTQATRFHSYKCEVSVNGSPWVRRASFDAASEATIGEQIRSALA